MKTIYLAGGCFWGLEAYMARVPGVVETSCGYANGRTTNPTYEEVCRHNTGHAETVKVIYDPDDIELKTLLAYFFKVIDPVSINRQGGDIGEQYRTGIYYVDPEEVADLKAFIASRQPAFKKPIAVEVTPLTHYYVAEEYHQKYLDKNPNGYCHIRVDQVEEPVVEKTAYQKPLKAQLEAQLSPLEFSVTQEAATERPFSNAYYSHFERGLYVDITTGEPLFTSRDKFESGCGWPAFSKPILPEVLVTHEDFSHGMNRVEVRSRVGEAHLGHVFPDGPAETGGLRYCINSAALQFIPFDQMAEKGYGHLLKFV